MRIQIGIKLIFSITALAVFLANPFTTRAKELWESYNPLDDPNYRQVNSGKPQPQGETIGILVKQFESMTSSPAKRDTEIAQIGQPQPEHYTQSSTSEPNWSYYTEEGDYPFYAYGRRFPWRSTYGYTSSPRIPWWSLVPFVRDPDRHSFFFHRGHRFSGGFRFTRRHR